MGKLDMDLAWWRSFTDGRTPEEIAEIRAFAERAFPPRGEQASSTPRLDELIDAFLKFASGRTAEELDQLRRILAGNDLAALAGVARSKPPAKRLEGQDLWDLDAAISDLESQRAVFDHLFSSIIARGENEIEKIARDKLGFKEMFRVFLLSPDEETALQYGQSHLSDLISRMKDVWHAKMDWTV